MKKILLTLICIFSLCLLVACVSSDVSGTYKFSSMETSIEGKKVLVEVNKANDLLDFTLNPNYIVLKLNSDGSYKLVLDGKQTNNLTVEETGSWTESDGKVTLTSSENVVNTATANDGELILTYTVYGVASVLTLVK